MPPKRDSFLERTSALIPKDLQARNLQRTSYSETLAHVLKGNIGAGLFAMGDAFKNSGLILGSIGTLILGVICVYNNHVLVRLARAVKKRKHISGRPTFPETITYCIELGPPKFRKCSRSVMIIMKTFICITQLGFCVIYISLVGETLHNVLKGTCDLSVRVWIAITFPVLLVASLIHTLKILAPISAISTVFLFYAFAVAVVQSSLSLPDISERNLVAPVILWPLFVGTVIFSFEGIALVIPLKNEMKEPQKFDKIMGPLNVGLSIMGVMLVTLGFLSYLRFGDEVEDSVTFNLPQNWVGISAQSVFAIGILFTYPIQFYVPAKLFMKDIKMKWGPFRRPLLVEIGLRTALVTLTYVVAVVIPYINLLLSLIGVVCSNALALFFPAVGDICLRCSPPTEEELQVDPNDDDKEPMPALDKNGYRFFMDAISLLLSVVGTIFGAYVAIDAIVKKFVEEVKEGIK